MNTNNINLLPSNTVTKSKKTRDNVKIVSKNQKSKSSKNLSEEKTSSDTNTSNDGNGNLLYANKYRNKKESYSNSYSNSSNSINPPNNNHNNSSNLLVGFKNSVVSNKNKKQNSEPYLKSKKYKPKPIKKPTKTNKTKSLFHLHKGSKDVPLVPPHLEKYFELSLIFS